MAKQDQELNVYEHFKHKTTTGEYYFLTIIDDNGVQTINLSTEDKDIFYFGTSIDNDILIVSDAVDYLQGYLKLTEYGVLAVNTSNKNAMIGNNNKNIKIYICLMVVL